MNTKFSKIFNNFTNSFIIQAVWLIFGAVLAFLTRNITSDYNESKSIAYAVSKLLLFILFLFLFIILLFPANKFIFDK